MKKCKNVMLIVCASIFLILCACSSKESEPEITLDDVTQAIQTVDPQFEFNDEPMYSMIGASNGWMGYLNDTTPVKVYQYESKDKYEESKETFAPMMDEWPVVGTFVLECSDTSVQDAFSALSQEK